MYWADRIAKEILDSGKFIPYWVDDMKTPSGRVHIGSVRAVVSHELIYRALKQLGEKVEFTYVFDDQDPMDGLPVYLDQEEYRKHLGKPLWSIPSPEPGYKSYAERWGKEYIEIFNMIGVKPKIIWGSELYRRGRMNEMVRLCLDKAKTIRGIYKTLYGKERPDNWFPFQVICEKCGKLSTTLVTDWDGEKVSYECKVNALDWTEGCGYAGKISPFSDKNKIAGKLPWKVEWPCKWKVIGVTIEGAGKDHMTAGGSHDFAKLMCQKVLDYPVPYGFSHEFFLVGGKKMSSSKGLGSSAKEVSEIIPAYIIRFMISRVKFSEQINFDPNGTMTIPDLFDLYDEVAKEYWNDPKTDKARVYELSQMDAKAPKEHFFPRFRHVVSYIQMPNINLKKFFAEKKGEKLNNLEKEALAERVKYARIWISKYAPTEAVFQISDSLPPEAKKLTDKQKDYLSKLTQLVKEIKDASELEEKMYKLANELGIPTKDAFSAIYLALSGKDYGPRAAWFLLKYPKEKVVERLKDAANLEVTKSSKQTKISTIDRRKHFCIDSNVNEIYPSISIGIALIKGVKIKKTDRELEKEKKGFVEKLENLTTEEIGKYPEIASYRRLYKEMGVDWHSKRPSPEALLRRVALKKGLYNVNTCVDAYNLVVMLNRVSVGAFDADKIKFPTVLRFANEGDEILLLGDEKPTRYTSKELAYYDQAGGYNIDFNYRDAQRTMVTEGTSDLWINVDGVYDISTEQVQKTLEESIEKIIKYCGGNLVFKGVVR